MGARHAAKPPYHCPAGEAMGWTPQHFGPRDVARTRHPDSGEWHAGRIAPWECCGTDQAVTVPHETQTRTSAPPRHADSCPPARICRCYKVCNDQIMLNFVVYVTPQPVPARFLYKCAAHPQTGADGSRQ